MSTPDQSSTPPLTRRQLREIRNTGATPVIPATPEETEPAPAPLPRAAEPAPVAPAPRSDASVDLGVSPLTRRQAREQERIRTASVPVISADVAAEHGYAPAPAEAAPAPADSAPQAAAIRTEPSRSPSIDTAVHELGLGEVVSRDETATDEALGGEATADGAAAGESNVGEATAGEAKTDAAAATVSDRLGSDLLAGEVTAAELPPSFDQLLTRETAASGAVTTPNALILSQTPSAPPLVGPVTATGEVIVTGTFDLPEGLGSTGHVPGTADGLDADAVLIDGELPPASSPTPIAASAAISTVKSADEIIRPPAPEKGSRLMLALAITAGALALALIGVLILAVATGVFS